MLLHIDSKQEVKWGTVLFPPDIDDITYCSVIQNCKYVSHIHISLSRYLNYLVHHHLIMFLSICFGNLLSIKMTKKIMS